MKVVLFCGGFGTRLREHSDAIPKPLVDIGNRPIILHLMRYYAHFGHKEFVLCLGYKGEMIKEYFLNYNSYKHRDFIMRDGGTSLDPAESDIADWTIHFVDTGLHNNIGQRLVAAKDHIGDDENFLANYSDQLSDFPLPDIIDFHNKNDMIASILSARPAQSFHHLETDDTGMVTKLGPMTGAGGWVNGGYMVLNRKIFDFIESGEELVEEPFQRLIEIGKLGSVRWTGFYATMDTYKDKINFDRLEGRRERPWELGRHGS
jgi:glucose-1-phosphate cytidylyltransferase